MYQMCDIHMHIIPEVDDGAWNQEMAEMMLYQAYFQGIDCVIATPHSSAFVLNETREKVEPNFEKLKKWTEEKLPGFKFYRGCEVYFSEYDRKESLRLLEEGVIPTMNGTRYVLTEFSTGVTAETMCTCVEQLLSRKYIPVIAHVERCKCLADENGVLFAKRLKEMGCLFQINVFSVFEETKEYIKGNARMLLDERLADFLGSDAHRTYHRPPRVELGLKYLYENYETEYIDKIACKNAEELLLV